MLIQDKKNDFEKTIARLQEDLNSVRTNRAAPSLIENIKAEVYGAKMPLSQLASITCPEPKQLVVEPWDKNILKDVEKAIETMSLGLSIKNEGNLLRLMVSPMTEETRKLIIKNLHEKIETGRMALRGLRDKIKEEIIKQERNKEISEDEKYNLIKELDEMTKEYTEKISEMGKKKEEEIMI